MIWIIMVLNFSYDGFFCKLCYNLEKVTTSGAKQLRSVQKLRTGSKGELSAFAITLFFKLNLFFLKNT